MQYISAEQLERLAEPIRNNQYGRCLLALCREPHMTLEMAGQ
jgi:hypothetical protein